MGKIIRQVLPTVTEFKAFWKKQGPFRYALTSREFPPILLEPEEWVFSDDVISLLKSLMKWDERKMKIVSAPFNRKKQNILKPESLSPWKINNFPGEWEATLCDAFTPVGHLTQAVVPEAENMDAETAEVAFFKCLEGEINGIGYVLLGPEPSLGNPLTAFVDEYVKEWELDDSPC